MIQIVLWYFLKVFGKILGMAFGLWLLKELTMGINKSERNLRGKVAVITGGTDGLGLETAIQLAKRGCQIIITYRNQVKALCLKILTKFLLLSLRADVNFDTFADAFLPLENSNKFLPILFML